MVNSMSAVRIQERFGAYAASKAALAAATKTLAMELGRFGIRVNGVHPGYIWGDSVERYFHYQADRRGITFEELYDEVAAETALGYLPALAPRSPAPSCSSPPTWPSRSPARRSTSTPATGSKGSRRRDAAA